MLYTVIKADTMNAGWFLGALEMFKTAFLKAGIPATVFAARIQHLKKEGPFSTLYCDDAYSIAAAKQRGYTTEPLQNFTEDVIQSQWQIKDFHWQIEYYIYYQGATEPATFAFYSYVPAAEIRSAGPVHLHISLAFPFTQDSKISIVESGEKYADALRKEMSKAMRLPLSDPRFDSLRG